MEKIDLLIHSGHILTIDQNMTQIANGTLAIHQGKIIAIGDSSLKDTYQADAVIDASNHIIMPGLINTHAHYAMSVMRGYADDYALWVWLQEYVWPLERKILCDEMVRIGTDIGMLEGIRSGTTCFNESYFFNDTAATACEKAGLRAIVTSVFALHLSEEKLWSSTKEFIEKWLKHDLVTPSLGPHGPHSVDEKNIIKLKQMALDYDVPFHFHLAESPDESQIIMERAGTTPVQYCQKLNLLDAKTLAAHCIHVNDQDIDILAETDTKVLHNAVSNMKLASGYCDIQKMMDKGINVSLATDGPVSNNTLDMFNTMKHTALLHKHVSDDPTASPAEEVVRMATINGAKGLLMEDKIGSLEVGKRADIICIDIDQPHLQPCFNPYANIVYSAQGSDVNHVIVDGQILMQDRIIKTIDEAKTISELKEFTKDL